ncbi:DUF4234 domain-containing protein [Glycomyces tarimensis]
MPGLKTRSPFGVWVLSIITAGIYYLFWAASMCGEVKTVNPQGEENRTGSNVVLSILFGAFTLYIWPAINWFKFCNSVKAEQRAAGLAPTFNTGLATLLVFLLNTHICYVQSQQNLVVAAAAQRHQAVPTA